jgi:hypothetical protein
MKRVLWVLAVLCTAFAASGQDLFSAAGNGDLDTVKNLVEKANVSVDVRDSNNNTPIFWALDGIDKTTDNSQNQKLIAVCKYLLDKGALADTTNRFGFTPLVLAINIGNATVTDLLLQKGVDYTKTVHLNVGTGPILAYTLAWVEALNNYHKEGTFLALGILCNYDLAHGKKLPYKNYEDNYAFVIAYDDLGALKQIVSSGASIEGAGYMAYELKRTDILDWLSTIGMFDPNKKATCKYLNVSQDYTYFEWAQRTDNAAMLDYLSKYSKQNNAQ